MKGFRDVRRRIERKMSICLTRFPISGLGKPKLYQNMWCFTSIRKIVKRMSSTGMKEETSLIRT
jgi:hypothetical protein